MKQRSIWEIGFKAVVIIGLLIVIIFQFDKKESIVYVDAVKLVNGYKGMQAARKEFEFAVQKHGRKPLLHPGSPISGKEQMKTE